MKWGFCLLQLLSDAVLLVDDHNLTGYRLVAQHEGNDDDLIADLTESCGSAINANLA
jgi:hypothetical protein